MAPTSYQSPHVGDKEDKHTYSQSAESNLSHSQSTVANILEQKGSDVVTVRPSDTIGTVVETLRDKRIGAVVVTDQNGAVVGILSERDIVRRLADTPGRTLPQKVEDLMTREVQVCNPEDPLFEVLKHMNEGRFRHMPVMKDDAMVGIITVGDVVGYRLNELEYEALRMRMMIVG
ncbi:CBS domain-containing protein [Aliiroseovarius sp.]|uniref:CBS domain-containing protein n=1 Tax=Aliiroseovarius sp. TaxID=1872442 RepID=UPI00260E0794|nr:CBS domain-containing protein [Aliiroseovarius sp.]